MHEGLRPPQATALRMRSSLAACAQRCAMAGQVAALRAPHCKTPCLEHSPCSSLAAGAHWCAKGRPAHRLLPLRYAVSGASSGRDLKYRLTKASAAAVVLPRATCRAGSGSWGSRQSLAAYVCRGRPTHPKSGLLCWKGKPGSSCTGRRLLASLRDHAWAAEARNATLRASKRGNRLAPPGCSSKAVGL